MSSSTSPTTPSTSSVSATQSTSPGVGRERCRFTPEEEVALFREVLSHKSPFERGSLILDSVATNFSSGGKKFATRLCGDRCQVLVKDFIKADNKPPGSLGLWSRSPPFSFSFVSVPSNEKG